MNEVGNDYNFLLEGAKSSLMFRITEDDTDNLLLEAISNQVKSHYGAWSSSEGLPEDDCEQEEQDSEDGTQVRASKDLGRFWDDRLWVKTC